MNSFLKKQFSFFTKDKTYLKFGFSENTFIFFLKSCWIFLFLYSAVHLISGAYLAAAISLTGFLFLVPLNYYLEIKKHYNISRYLFIFSCCCYTLFVSVAYNQSVGLEYYFIPTFLIPLVAFDDTRKILLGFLFPTFAWLCHSFFPHNFPFKEYLVNPVYSHWFAFANFVGAYFWISVFALKFIETIDEQNKILIKQSKISILGEIAGDLAHEINNPLGIIMLKTDAVLSEINKDSLIDREKIHEHLEKIILTAERIKNTTQSLSSFTKVSDKGVEQEITFFEVLREVIFVFSNRIEQSKVQFNYQFEPSLKVTVSRVLLTQVLTSFLKSSLNTLLDPKNEFSQERKIWIQCDTKNKDFYFSVSCKYKISLKLKLKSFFHKIFTQDKFNETEFDFYLLKQSLPQNKLKIFLEQSENSIKWQAHFIMPEDESFNSDELIVGA